MKKAKKVSCFLFSAVMFLCAVAIGVSWYHVASAEASRKINANRNDPINGDEREFLRMFKLEDGEMTMHVSNLQSDKFVLPDEGNYSFVALCHNASDKELTNVKLELSYPGIIAYGRSSVAVATITWQDADDQTNEIVSSLVLEPVEDMAMSARDVYIVVNDVMGKSIPFNRDVSVIDGIVTQEIYLGTVPAGEAGNYTIFVVSGVHSII